MRIILLGVFLLTSLQLLAQRECASAYYVEQQKLADPSYSNNASYIESLISKAPLQSAASEFKTTAGNGVIRIPVVVHIVYNTVGQNISDAQVKSGIDALNRDFRKRNSDTVNTPAHFKSLAADAEIEFILATADPKGRATTGIIRKSTSVSNWKMDDKIKYTAQGGDDAWDSKSYLNIWVGNLVGLLGYASAPGGAMDKDGVVIHSTAFGTINVAAPYHLGRTAVHEVGHWLGLKHIWGDAYCGDDLVDDTPKQGSYTPGCPGGFRSSCNNGASGDMFMNYMDFTDDACINLFTEGQKQRMRSLFIAEGPRNSLLNSKALNMPWLEAAPIVELPAISPSFRYFPNPATTTIHFDFAGDLTWLGKEIRIISSTGILVNTIIISSSMQSHSLASLSPGIYFIQAENNSKKVREKFIKL
jgi:hypothetical protein